MALDTFDNLKAEFVDELKATELTLGQQNSIVARVEDILKNDFDFFEGETTVSDIFTGGVTEFDLPDDFLETRQLILDVNPKASLDYLTPQAFDLAWAGSSSGQPQAYTTQAKKIRPGPAPDNDYAFKHTYSAKFLPLSDSQTTNFVLAEYPTLYLQGCLWQATAFLQMEPQDTAKYEGQYRLTARSAETRDWKKRAGRSPMMQRHDYGITRTQRH